MPTVLSIEQIAGVLKGWLYVKHYPEMPNDYLVQVATAAVQQTKPEDIKSCPPNQWLLQIAESIASTTNAISVNEPVSDQLGRLAAAIAALKTDPTMPVKPSLDTQIGAMQLLIDLKSPFPTVKNIIRQKLTQACDSFGSFVEGSTPQFIPRLRFYSDDFYWLDPDKAPHYKPVSRLTIKNFLFDLCCMSFENVKFKSVKLGTAGDVGRDDKGNPAQVEITTASTCRPSNKQIDDLVEVLKCQLEVVTDRVPCWLDTDLLGLNVVNLPSPTAFIPLKNGLLDIKTNRILPHSPSLFILNSLPFEYDPANPPGPPTELLKTMRAWWGDDDEPKMLLQEFFGYAISGRTDLQRLLMLIGATRGGKGIVERLLQALLGIENCVSISSDSFAGNFGMQSLIGKSLMVIPDARFDGRPSQASAVEKLLGITGEDSLAIDRKNKTMWTGKVTTRVMIGANMVPRLKDNAKAMANRTLLLHFYRSFVGDDADPQLENRLHTQLPETLGWALEHFNFFCEHNRRTRTN